MYKQRPIKFRAWRKNKMVGPFTLEEMLNVAAEMGFHLDAPSPVVWMQYTGLSDKNGQEIFEGDILEGGIYKKYLVEWDFEENGWNIKTYAINHGDFTIIGNVHENQELGA